MQYKRLITEIGTIKIQELDGNIARLELPKKPSIKKTNFEYSYNDLLNLEAHISAGTKFQRDVWNYLRKIPYGKTLSYGDVAKKIKRKRAYRAVGQACKMNPIPIIIPCHRVVSSKNSIGGFSPGVAWKKFLIDLENSRTKKENLI